MKIRLVAGSLKGRVLSLPDRDSFFRPTQGRIRESAANILMPVVRGAAVADVCAGSGACGFELLSRGAAHVTFVEQDTFRSKRILTHAETFGVSAKCTVTTADFIEFFRRTTTRFDIVYLDPPYDLSLGSETGKMLRKLLTPNGILLFERRGGKGRPAEDRILRFEGLQLTDTRSYGMTELLLYKLCEN